MKLRNLALLAALACTAPALAQEPPRLVVFHPEWVVENTAQGRRVFAEAQILGKRLTDNIKAKAEELEKMKQQMGSSSISDDGRKKIAEEFEKGRAQLQRMQEDGQAQYQKVEQVAVQQFQSEIGPIVEALAEEQKLHLVLQASAMVAWADQAWIMKFTEEVARRYDDAYPGGAPAKAPPAPSTKTTPAGPAAKKP
jgi:Skp family chaperone for outer membrane proteins